jgi:hypothetical protein
VVANIKLVVRPQLVREALWWTLRGAGFTIFDESHQAGDDTIVVIDFADCKDSESLSAHQSRGGKIVALTTEADSRELEPEEIALLSGAILSPAIRTRGSDDYWTSLKPRSRCISRACFAKSGW